MRREGRNRGTTEQKTLSGHLIVLQFHSPIALTDRKSPLDGTDYGLCSQSLVQSKLMKTSLGSILL